MINLFTPINDHKLILKNRLVMPPLATKKGNDDGSVSLDILNYYQKLSEDSIISLIIIEHSYINIEGKLSLKQLGIDNDLKIESFTKLNNIIENNNTKAIVQLTHAGSARKLESDFIIKSASNITHPVAKITPNAMSKEDIKKIINDFVSAAIRVEKAGFYGVQLHSAHGYLLNQFLSPLTNQRTDEYGGNSYNRIRIHLEIINQLKKVLNPKTIISIRLGFIDGYNNGITMDDIIIACKEFEKANVDILDISAGFNGFIKPYTDNFGYFKDITKAISKIVKTKVILTGGIKTLKEANYLLNNGYADLIGVGTSQYKDPKWAKKTYLESIKYD